MPAATFARREQKLSAKSLTLQPAIHSQAGQAKARHVMACKPASNDLRRAGIVNRGGAQAIETENGFVVGIVNRKEGFRSAQFVALAGVTAQEFVQRFGRYGNAQAAVRSLEFGAGGFSSQSRTRKLSLSETCT